MKRFVHCTHCNMLNGVDDSVRDGGTVFCKRCKKNFTFHSEDAHRISRKIRLICQCCGHEAEYDEYYMSLMDNRPKCFECSNEIVTDDEEQKRLRRIKEENNAAIEAKKSKEQRRENKKDDVAGKKDLFSLATLIDCIGFTFQALLAIAFLAAIIGGPIYLIVHGIRHPSEPKYVREITPSGKIHYSLDTPELHKLKKIAWEATKDYVLIAIQTPRTAKFPYIDVDKYVSEVSDGVFKVSAYVDYQNTFGATIRSYFTATVTRESGYKVVDFSVN